MTVVYLSGPLWAPTKLGRLLNILRAAREAWRLARAGYAVICPHLNTGLFTLLPFVDGERMARWLDADLAIIERLLPGDQVRMMRGWERSSGAGTELSKASQLPGVWVYFADGRPSIEMPLRGRSLTSGLLAQTLGVAGAEALPAKHRDAVRSQLLDLLTTMRRIDPVHARALWELMVTANELLLIWDQIDLDRPETATTGLHSVDDTKD